MLSVVEYKECGAGGNRTQPIESMLTPIKSHLDITKLSINQQLIKSLYFNKS